MMSRRLQRSRNTPTYGPRTEYGTRSTAKPAAILTEFVSWAGLNSTEPARAAWNRPSPYWLISRTESSRRKPLRRASAWTCRWRSTGGGTRPAYGAARAVVPGRGAVGCRCVWHGCRFGVVPCIGIVIGLVGAVPQDLPAWTT